MVDGQGTHYRALLAAHPAWWPVVGALVFLIALGGYCAITMDHAGHHITGMNNHVVWGLPHVFAIALIVAASGAMNGATFASLFGQRSYQPWARHCVALAIALLIGGLLVLVLDLGRPDRLAIAITTHNFRSIFSWNIFLYTGFILVGACYLWMMTERRFNRHVKKLGYFALAWRMVLTTGTGCIFGFLVGRDALDSALLAPLFIALSLVMGTAVLALTTTAVAWLAGIELNVELRHSLRRLLAWFLVALLYFSTLHHLTNLYVSEHHAMERFFLLGPMAGLFWIGHVGIGIVLALLLCWPRRGSAASPVPGGLTAAAVAALLGGFALVYVIVIGAQSMPQRLFPGKRVLASTFGDGGFAAYVPSGWEFGLGLGGVAGALLLFLLVLRVFPFTPESG